MDKFFIKKGDQVRFYGIPSPSNGGGWYFLNERRQMEYYGGFASVMMADHNSEILWRPLRLMSTKRLIYVPMLPYSDLNWIETRK